MTPETVNAAPAGPFRIAAFDEAGGQQVCRSVLMDELGTAGARFAGLENMRQFGPADRKIREVDIEHRLALASDQRHRLTAKAGKPFGQCRLVGERADDAETVFSRNVGCGEDAGNAGMCLRPAIEVTEGEAGVIMRRADHQHRQCIGGEGIAAEFLSPGDFRHAIEPDGRGTDRVA